MIISPNCGTEYEECPYYRLHSVITEIHDKLEDETFDDETLRYIQVSGIYRRSYYYLLASNIPLSVYYRMCISSDQSD